MPWFCLKTGWRKRTVRLIDYIILRLSAYVNSTEVFIRYIFFIIDTARLYTADFFALGAKFVMQNV